MADNQAKPETALWIPVLEMLTRESEGGLRNLGFLSKLGALAGLGSIWIGKRNIIRKRQV